MNRVGAPERDTQDRIVGLFKDRLGYDYLGNWQNRSGAQERGNQNIETSLLRSFLQRQGYSDPLIDRALCKLDRAAALGDGHSLYDANKNVYGLLRYGVKVKVETGAQHQTVWLIDWKNPKHNHFALDQEVTVRGKTQNKRPDIVLYLNGMAIGVIELKCSTVDLSKGIRQHLLNQQNDFIRPFFTTMQLLMAGNDTQGLRYGSIETGERYYLEWKEDGGIGEHKLDRHLSLMCEKSRLLELIHDFIIFDMGTKKICRHNQYFGIKAAQDSLVRQEGGIIWHTQGSGKSLTMVWLAKWIREQLRDSRVLIITDRTDLDDQIEGVFRGVDEDIYRTTSGADLVHTLNKSDTWLICSLIHKFSGSGAQEGAVDRFMEEIRKNSLSDFEAKGNIYVFVDECHRTQSGTLHAAMKEILPSALFLGFTGTPLLRDDKQSSLGIFGPYMHTYKFDEAVKDGMILDLRYEARDIDQNITSQDKIDLWFEAKTKGLTDLARAQLKRKWGTLQKVFSAQSRLERIVSDIVLDMARRDRLANGRGNAILVSGSIYQACKFYELFKHTDLSGKCALITSYKPSAKKIQDEESGEGYTERLRQYEVYRNMLTAFFPNMPADKAINQTEAFERQVKEKFIKEPGQMRLLIVVDKLLTGFDAPPATYLYIDKTMQDHGLFQAICRVNRLDGEDKEYGYIIDYKDLFNSLASSIQDYTSGAFDGYDKADVTGLLKDHLGKARERLEETREAVKALCENVASPKDTAAYIQYFCAAGSAYDKAALQNNEARRLTLYKESGAFIRAYAALANEMAEAGYSPEEIESIKDEVQHYESVRTEVKMASGDYIDMKVYEPSMRHLIDSYIRAEESQKISAFDDLSLIQLIVERGEAALKELPEGIRHNGEAVAETIENNIRKVIIDEQPVNPKYYEKMSALLDALIQERKVQAFEYENYLKKIIELSGKVACPEKNNTYPKSLDSAAKRALFDNLGRDEALALKIDDTIFKTRKDSWRGNHFKEGEIKKAIGKLLSPHNENTMQVAESSRPYGVDSKIERIFELVKNQNEY